MRTSYLLTMFSSIDKNKQVEFRNLEGGLQKYTLTVSVLVKNAKLKVEKIHNSVIENLCPGRPNVIPPSPLPSTKAEVQVRARVGEDQLDQAKR